MGFLAFFPSTCLQFPFTQLKTILHVKMNPATAPYFLHPPCCLPLHRLLSNKQAPWCDCLFRTWTVTSLEGQRGVGGLAPCFSQRLAWLSSSAFCSGQHAQVGRAHLLWAAHPPEAPLAEAALFPTLGWTAWSLGLSCAQNTCCWLLNSEMRTSLLFFPIGQNHQ